MSTVISVKNLTKSFKLYHNNQDRLLNIVPFVNKKFDTYTAVDNVSFEVKRGEFVSIIGKNGSGKSTLLKILCGVLEKTDGEYKVNGSVVSLLELGTGFNPDLSGRDNIISSSKTMNLDIKHIENKMGEIEAFADLKEYFEMPIKTYSSGMYVRLAMSLFLHLNPDVFIIDEALSVGDIFFQQKCFTKIEEMRKKGVAFLFVSHDINTVQNMSDRVLLLNHSNLIYFGNKHKACKLYYDLDNKPANSLRSVNPENKDESLSSYEHSLIEHNLLKNTKEIIHRNGGRITYLQILDELGRNTVQVALSKSLKFIIGYEFDDVLDNPTLNIAFYNNKNIHLTSILYDLDKDYKFIEIMVPFLLEAGEYTFKVGIGDRKINTATPIVECISLFPISIIFDYHKYAAPFLGMVGFDTTKRYLNDLNTNS